MVMMLVGDLHQCLCSVSRADGLPRFNALRIHASIPLCVHHSLEGEHVHALRSRERGCFLVVQTLWAEKIQSTTDAGSLNTFSRNEIEAALISSALLRIACLVILYKTSYQELAADGCNRTGMRTRARLLKQNENRRDGAATGPWSYLVVRSCGSGDR